MKKYPLFLLALTSLNAFAAQELTGAGAEQYVVSSQYDEPSAPAHCPNESKFFANLGGGIGFSNYKIDSHINGDVNIDRAEFTGPTAAFNQTLGLRDIIELGLSQEFTLGYANRVQYQNVYLNNSEYLPRIDYNPVKHAHFLELSGRISGLCRVAENTQLRPFAGFALHSAYVKGRFNNVASNITMLRQRFNSPFVGLGLTQVMSSLSMSFDMSLLFPRGKQKLPMRRGPSYATLNTSRHGLEAALKAVYKASKSVKVYFSSKYTTYSIRGTQDLQGSNGNGEINANYTSRFMLSMGASYTF